MLKKFGLFVASLLSGVSLYAAVAAGPAGSFINNQNTLQQGATFYVSSGTVSNLQTATLKFNDGTTMTTAASGTGGTGSSGPSAYGSLYTKNGAVNQTNISFTTATLTFFANAGISTHAVSNATTDSVTVATTGIFNVYAVFVASDNYGSSNLFYSICVNGVPSNFSGSFSPINYYIPASIAGILSLNVGDVVTLCGFANESPGLGISIVNSQFIVSAVGGIGGSSYSSGGASSPFGIFKNGVQISSPAAQINFSGNYWDITLGGTSTGTVKLIGGNTNYIQVSNTLQSGATAYPQFLNTNTATILSSITINGLGLINGNLFIAEGSSITSNSTGLNGLDFSSPNSGYFNFNGRDSGLGPDRVKLYGSMIYLDDGFPSNQKGIYNYDNNVGVVFTDISILCSDLSTCESPGIEIKNTGVPVARIDRTGKIMAGGSIKHKTAKLIIDGSALIGGGVSDVQVIPSSGMRVVGAVEFSSAAYFYSSSAIGNYVAFIASESIATSQYYVLPRVPGTADQILAINNIRPDGKITTYWKTDANTGGSGGSSSLGVFQNGTQISSPTAQINFIGPPFSVSLGGSSTATVTLNGSSVTLGGVLTAGSGITITPGTGITTITGSSCIYPATATASFPYGLSSSTGVFSSSVTLGGNILIGPVTPMITSFGSTIMNYDAGGNLFLGPNDADSITIGRTVNANVILRNAGSNLVTLTNGYVYVTTMTVYGSVTSTTGFVGNGSLLSNLTPSSLSAGALPSNVIASSFTATGVTAGSYTNTNLTVDAQGRITAASNGSGSGGASVYPATSTVILSYGLSSSTGVFTSSVTAYSLAVQTGTASNPSIMFPDGSGGVRYGFYKDVPLKAIKIVSDGIGIADFYYTSIGLNYPTTITDSSGIPLYLQSSANNTYSRYSNTAKTKYGFTGLITPDGEDSALAFGSSVSGVTMSSEAARIDVEPSSARFGNVGINISTPTAKLHVGGTMIVESTFTVSQSTIVLNGTTYYWNAGTGSSGQFLKTDGAARPTLTWGSASAGGGTSSSSFTYTFNAAQANLPGANSPYISNSTNAASAGVFFDETSTQTVTWATMLNNYNGGTLYSDIVFTSSATTGTMNWGVYIECKTPNADALDYDTDSFSTVNSTSVTVGLTSGMAMKATATLTNQDSCANGDTVRMKLERRAGESDTAVGKGRVRFLRLYE